jgi:hypothetical protein
MVIPFKPSKPSTLQPFKQSTVHETMNQLDAELRRTDKGTVTMRKIMRVFLFGTLFGVMLAAAFTFVFAIPANNYYWQTEIWKRGGAAWTFDMKTGRSGWKWLVEPKSDTPRPKRVTVPEYRVNVRSEQL